MTEYGWDSSLQEAKDAGIPVIIVDREVKVEDENLYTVWAGSDFRLEGDRACAWLEAYLETQPGLKDSKIGIVDVQGTLDASAQIGRSDALLEAVKKHENWELLAVECGDFVQAKGREVMEQMLKEYGSRINVVYCENDNMAYGVLEALENAGMKAGTDLSSGEVLVISFDAARQGLEKTLQGEIAVDTECNPLYGPILSRIIMALEQGDELPKRNYFEEKQFSSLDTVSEAVVNDSSYPVVMLTRIKKKKAGFVPAFFFSALFECPEGAFIQLHRMKFRDQPALTAICFTDASPFLTAGISRITAVTIPSAKIYAPL